MGRIRRDINVRGREFWTLFDSGARNTYVTEEVAGLLVTQQLPKNIPALLGGITYNIGHSCLLMAYIEEKFVDTNARVVSQIGMDEDGKTLDILFGSLAMSNWGIRLIPDEEKVDMTNYPNEFVEF